MEQVKAFTNCNPSVLAGEVNAYINKLYGEGRELVDITFATAPWADDGVAGTNYTAFVLSAETAY